MIWSRNKNVASNAKIMPKSTDYAASDHELFPRILNPPEPCESYYLVQDASRGFPTSFSSPVTFFGVWPRSPMPHLFLIANSFACDAYLFLGVYLVLQPNYDMFDKQVYDTILSSI